jgi:hypothetical protein
MLIRKIDNFAQNSDGKSTGQKTPFSSYVMYVIEERFL